MRTASRLPVGQFVVALVVSIQINQLGMLRECNALRMINLDAPQMALQGDTIRLTCSFSLASEPARAPKRTRANGNGSSDDAAKLIDRPSEAFSNRMSPDEPQDSSGGWSKQPSRSRPGRSPEEEPTADLLYAIKWYKDEREFYQFVTENWPRKRAHPLPGLDVDVDKSDNQTVVLKSVSLKTSGLFRCEVSTDAPSFVTKSIERKIFIYSLPAEGPVIEANLPRSKPNRMNLYMGDQLELRCSSRESKPNTELDWIVNESLNLSAKSPLGADGSPLFRVATHSFVRVPKTTLRSGENIVGAPVKPLSNLFQSRSSGQNRPATSSGLTSELVSVRNRDSTARLDNSLVSADSLDQFLETSVSILNFTVDTNLSQHLQLYGSRQSLNQSHHQNWTAHKSAGLVSARRPSQGTASRAKKITADSKLSEQGAQSNGLLGALLDIRCVARVMHLRMSDEIKLMIVNRTKPVSWKIVPEMQRQAPKVDSSASDSVKKVLRNYFPLDLALLIGWSVIKEFLVYKAIRPQPLEQQPD